MNRKELKELIKSDRQFYASRSLLHRLFDCITLNSNYNYKKIIIVSRKFHYYKQKNWRYFIPKWYYTRKLNKMAVKLNINIKGNFGKKLKIFHQNITINQYAHLGNNIILHGNNCIGNNGTDFKNCPIIGNNVEIGYGATIIGNIKIADNVIIGANSLVNKDFLDEGCTIAGNPAKKIKDRK